MLIIISCAERNATTETHLVSEIRNNHTSFTFDWSCLLIVLLSGSHFIYSRGISCAKCRSRIRSVTGQRIVDVYRRAFLRASPRLLAPPAVKIPGAPAEHHTKKLKLHPNTLLLLKNMDALFGALLFLSLPAYHTSCNAKIRFLPQCWLLKSIAGNAFPHFSLEIKIW